MQHLDERHTWEVLLDGVNFTVDENEHLSLCSECQQLFAMLTLVQDEFVVARASEVGLEAEAQLFSILEQASNVNSRESALGKLFGKMDEMVMAIPLWDSRQETSALGVRSINQSSYRMLFGIDETEIELMVEPRGRFLRLVGEVIVADSDDANGLALIELAATADAKSAFETESDEQGRFSMDQILPGTYVMTITPRFSQMVVIEPLELT